MNPSAKRQLWLLLVLIVSNSVWARQEQSFTTLSNLVQQADYVVIAAVERKSPESYMDGWVKYECRFLYWLKAPENPRLLENVLAKQPQPSGIKPLPLHEIDTMKSENFPPGAPHTNAVILVDDHEKAYHRLNAGEPFMSQRPASHMPLYNKYQLLFLRQSEGHYVTVGTYQSILPVSPVLDLMKLPSQPHMDHAGKPKVNMSTEEAVRFIVKDYFSFKENELKEIKRDLGEVLENKK